MKTRLLTIIIAALLVAYGLALAFAVPAPAAPALTIYYAAPTATGLGNCSSWANACTLASAASTSSQHFSVARSSHRRNATASNQ